MDGVNALHSEINWPELTPAKWQWLASNPARPPDMPLGWVLDHDGRIDGFIGNFVSRYFRERQRYIAASGHSVIVSPRARGAIRDLLEPFTRQSGVFAASMLNANQIGGPIYAKLGMQPYPAETSAIKLSWILSPSLTFSARILRKVIEVWPQTLALIGEPFSPRGAAMFDPRSVIWPKGIHPIEDLSDSGSYAEFWKSLQAEGRLVADRSPAVIRWRMAQPDLTYPPLLLGYHDAEGLCAYAMAIMSKTGPVDVPTLEIIDLVKLDRAPPLTIPTLIRALKTAGYKSGACKVRLPLLGPSLLKALDHKVPKARNEGGWGHAYVHFTGQAEDFADWEPTALEGSYGFTLRQPKVKQPRARSRSRNSALAVTEA